VGAKPRLGSLVASTDGLGEVTGEYTYGVFGQPNETLPVPYGYTGHRYESELGLTDAGGRFYDAKFGIFLSPDPIGPLSGGSTFGNRYSYAGYDPINFVDPTGFSRGVDCEQEFNKASPQCTGGGVGVSVPDELVGGGIVVGVGIGVCYLAGCFDGDEEGGGGAEVINTDGDPVPDGTSNTGTSSKPKPHIVATADAQMFGASSSTYLPSSSQSGATVTWNTWPSEYPAFNPASVARLTGPQYTGLWPVLNSLPWIWGTADRVHAVAAFTPVGDVLTLMDYQNASTAQVAYSIANLAVSAALGPRGTGGVGAARGAASATKLTHIFGKAEHALDGFVKAQGGRQQAFQAIHNAANQALKEGKLVVGPNGILPSGNAGNIIEVGGTQIRLIGGRVIDGVVEIGSASRKGLP
jgi:RHS repeat-associated protein